jgi:hypothetical protein
MTVSALFVDAPEAVLRAVLMSGCGIREPAASAQLRAYAVGEEAGELALALELAGVPPVARLQGRHQDLAAVFDRVNAGHFRGEMQPPRLAWSRGHTVRKLGHYQPLTDTVVLSVSLDDPRVPDEVVDFVMYHELLHRQLGVQLVNGRHVAHSPAFRAAERRFPGYDRVQAWLKASVAGPPAPQRRR